MNGSGSNEPGSPEPGHIGRAHAADRDRPAKKNKQA
jgi:hypothetical protein